MAERFLESLSEEALAALPWLFEAWALPHQMPPEGDWRTWVIMGGRRRQDTGGGRMGPRSGRRRRANRPRQGTTRGTCRRDL